MGICWSWVQQSGERVDVMFLTLDRGEEVTKIEQVQTRGEIRLFCDNVIIECPHERCLLSVNQKDYSKVLASVQS